MPRRPWGIAGTAVGLGLAVLAAGLTLAGYDAGTALAALWNGAFGSWYAFTSATLVRAVPLILIGLGIALSFRAGAFNIGAEGQFYAGAIAATWVGLHVAASRPVAIPAVWSAALLAGGLSGSRCRSAFGCATACSRSSARCCSISSPKRW